MSTESFQGKYPKFIIFELTDTGPLVTHFETADDAALFLWGRDFSRLALFVNAELFHITTLDVDKLREQLQKL